MSDEQVDFLGHEAARDALRSLAATAAFAGYAPDLALGTDGSTDTIVFTVPPEMADRMYVRTIDALAALGTLRLLSTATRDGLRTIAIEERVTGNAAVILLVADVP